MHFILYFPGAVGASPSHFERCGLEDLLREGSADFVETINGPKGRGMIAFWDAGDPDANIAMTTGAGFEWHESAAREGQDRGRYWIGICKAKPPTPTDLKRRTMQRGTEMVLADGHTWTIPSAYYLPHDNGINWQTGRFERKPKGDLYFRYEARASVYAAQIFTQEDEIRVLCEMMPGADPTREIIDIPLEDSWEHAIEGLQINYRVNDEIVDLLGLLDDRSIVGVCCASFDLQLIQDAVKKKHSASPIGIPAGQTWLPDKPDTQRMESDQAGLRSGG